MGNKQCQEDTIKITVNMQNKEGYGREGTVTRNDSKIHHDTENARDRQCAGCTASCVRRKILFIFVYMYFYAPRDKK